MRAGRDPGAADASARARPTLRATCSRAARGRRVEARPPGDRLVRAGPSCIAPVPGPGDGPSLHGARRDDGGRGRAAATAPLVEHDAGRSRDVARLWRPSERLLRCRSRAADRERRARLPARGLDRRRGACGPRALHPDDRERVLARRSAAPTPRRPQPRRRVPDDRGRRHRACGSGSGTAIVRDADRARPLAHPGRAWSTSPTRKLGRGAPADTDGRAPRSRAAPARLPRPADRAAEPRAARRAPARRGRPARAGATARWRCCSSTSTTSSSSTTRSATPPATGCCAASRRACGASRRRRPARPPRRRRVPACCSPTSTSDAAEAAARAAADDVAVRARRSRSRRRRRVPGRGAASASRSSRATPTAPTAAPARRRRDVPEQGPRRARPPPSTPR